MILYMFQKRICTFYESLKKRQKEIHSMSSFKELMFYISDQSIEKTASFLLYITVLLPFLILLMQFFLKASDFFQAYYNISVEILTWFSILQIIGSLGTILGIIAMSKEIIIQKQKGVSLRSLAKQHYLPILFSSLIIWSFISSLFSSHPSLSLKGDPFMRDGFLIYLAYLGIFFCAYNIKDSKRIYRIIAVFVLVATLLSVLSLINNSWLNQILNIKKDLSVFNNKNHFGYYLCIAILANTVLINKIQPNKWRILWFGSLAVLSATLAQNESFGPFLASLFGLICLLLFSLFWHKKMMKVQLYILLLFTVVTVFVNWFSGSLIKDFVRLALDVHLIVNEPESAGGAGSSRWILWHYAIRFISEKPLFGYGLSTLGSQYMRFDVKMAQPHNEFLQYAASMGLPAVLLYITALMIYITRFIRSRLDASMLSACLFCTVIAYLASSLFGCLLFYTGPYLFLFIGLSSDRVRILGVNS